VNLATVTPLFLGGSEPRGDPELRPASFKGELRFWWRALWGGVYPNRAIDDLSAAESRVFGTTDEASPIVLRLGGEQPRQSAWRFGSSPGVDYLFFSMKGTRQDPDRKGFEAGQTFELTLQARLGQHVNERVETAFREACASLWLLVRLGGVGARSRRGAGNLCALEITDGSWPEALPPLKASARTAAEYARETSAGLAQLYEALHWSKPTGELTTWPEFDILHRKGGPIYVLDKEWSAWQDALNQVGAAYRDFRSRRQPDYAAVKDVVAGHTTHLDTVERAAFGLPIVFYYRSLGGQRGTLEGKDADRRSSPLVFHVAALNGSMCAVSFVRFVLV
jgi:CRISPR-associated protein Cmr1